MWYRSYKYIYNPNISWLNDLKPALYNIFYKMGLNQKAIPKPRSPHFQGRLCATVHKTLPELGRSTCCQQWYLQPLCCHIFVPIVFWSSRPWYRKNCGSYGWSFSGTVQIASSLHCRLPSFLEARPAFLDLVPSKTRCGARDRDTGRCITDDLFTTTIEDIPNTIWCEETGKYIV